MVAISEPMARSKRFRGVTWALVVLPVSLLAACAPPPPPPPPTPVFMAPPPPAPMVPAARG